MVNQVKLMFNSFKRIIIIYMNKLIHSDWLRAVLFKFNTVQITVKNYNIGLKIMGTAYIQEHLSMGSLNSQLGTNFSPIDTVLVSRLLYVNYCVITKKMFPCH